MRAYIYDPTTSDDQREAHDSGISVSDDELKALGLVFYSKIDLDGVEQIAKERGYKNADSITVSKAGLGDLYETKIKSFFKEHLHEDEEIRYIEEGVGYFDVRGTGDKDWVRIEVTPGDLLILPTGIYHRFTFNTGDFIRAKRLFKDAPKWVALDRSKETDENVARKEYVQSFPAVRLTA